MGNGLGAVRYVIFYNVHLISYKDFLLEWSQFLTILMV